MDVPPPAVPQLEALITGLNADLNEFNAQYSNQAEIAEIDAALNLAQEAEKTLVMQPPEVPVTPAVDNVDDLLMQLYWLKQQALLL